MIGRCPVCRRWTTELAAHPHRTLTVITACRNVTACSTRHAQNAGAPT